MSVGAPYTRSSQLQLKTSRLEICQFVPIGIRILSQWCHQFWVHQFISSHISVFSPVYISFQFSLNPFTFSFLNVEETNHKCINKKYVSCLKTGINEKDLNRHCQFTSVYVCTDPSKQKRGTALYLLKRQT